MKKVPYATAGLYVSLAAMVICCAPVGIVGVVLGVLSLRAAKQLGVPTPMTGIFAIVLGALSVVEMTGTYFWYQHDQEARHGKAGEALERARAGRHEDVLSQDTACALAENYLLEHHATDAAAVTCNGKVAADGTMASLPEVKLGDDRFFTVCFTKLDQWYAGAAITFGTCPREVAGLDALPKSPPEERAHALRSAFSAALKDSQRREFSSLMRHIVEAGFSGADEAPDTCPALKQVDAQVIDGDVVSKEGQLRAPQPGWEFLTTRAIRSAIDTDATPEDFAKAGERMGRYAVVLVTDERELPKKVDSSSFDSGFFDGMLVLVEVPTAEALCAQPFTFESSESIEEHKVGLKLGPKVNVGGNLEDDFEDNFKKSLRSTLDHATHGQVSANMTFF